MPDPPDPRGDPILGEIRLFGGAGEPDGWARCDGRRLDIDTHVALFSLLGTKFGGDGQQEFALPDLRGRVPMHSGPVHPLGLQGGVETVKLELADLPAHTHALRGSAEDANQGRANDAYPAAHARQADDSAYGIAESGLPPGSLHPTAITAVGQTRPHDNRQPYVGVNYIIAISGTWPPGSAAARRRGAP